MNTVVETILRRESIRHGFSSAPVPLEALTDVVCCGLAAPSSKNAQPWRFHVVSDRPLLRELADIVVQSDGREAYVPFDPVSGLPRTEWRSTVVESADVLASVPVAIFIENTGAFSHSRKALLEATPEVLAASIISYTLEVLGVGAALENMWIAAVAHGLAGVFMGDILIAEPQIRRRLGIERDLVGVLALGYSVVRPKQDRQSRGQLDPDQVRWVQPDDVLDNANPIGRD